MLEYAYRCCKANKGAAGVDGQEFEDIEAYGEERWLGELADTLRRKTYRAEAVRRVWIPEAGRQEQTASAGDSHASRTAWSDGGGAGAGTDLRGGPAAGAVRLPSDREGP